MNNYRILIIDENQEQIEEFEVFFDNVSRNGELNNQEFQIYSLTNIDTENFLYEYILKNEIDCVAFDYKLMENNSSFSQQGDIYQIHLLEHFEDFPTFIITNNADDYKIINADPFRIISKKIINFNADEQEEVKEAVNLIDKICQLVDRYKDNIQKTEDEFYTLITRQNKGEELNDDELLRIVELDSKLENSISKKSKIPKDWKSPTGIEAISNLVLNSENILQELKKLNNE
jgi:hypothetical protein